MARVGFNPAKAVLLSYLGLIAVGTTIFYLLPTTRVETPFVDILFTVTSAVTVTGLVVLDTEKDLTPLGQGLLLLLIQIGGLGYMTLSTFLLVALRRKIGLRDRLILSESLNYPGLFGLVRFLKRVILWMIAIELIGFLALFFLWVDRFPVQEALWHALFHSVSAFNNAGFSSFSDNLTSFRGDLLTNLVVCSLIILGGLGFFVLNDLYLFFKGKVQRISTHTKLVLLLSFGLISAGWLSLILTELFHKPLWDLPLGEKLLGLLFLSVSSRTAGFNTVDVASLSESSQFLLMILMFIGASPGGTGGGIKTVTLAVVLISAFSYVRGSDQAVVFERKIPERIIRRATTVLTLSISYIFLVNLLIDRFEEKDFLKTLFEVVSAFSTVGLSMGSSEGLSFCAEFSTAGKLLIILTMLVGRVGILSFAIALRGREKTARIGYPEARLIL